MYTLGLILTGIIILILLPFAAYSLAKDDWFFTLLESGNIKYIYFGDTLRRIIADVRGKKLDGHQLVDGEEERSFVEKTFRIYWVGVPLIASVKRFTIKPRKEWEETAGKAPTEWIRDFPAREVTSLRYAFPRPYLLMEVELGDRQTVNLLLICKFIVVDAYLPVVELKGDFFEFTGSILKGSVLDVLKKQKTMQDFINAPKGEGGILKELEKDSDLNEALRKHVGLRLVGIAIADWNPSDPKIREAMNKKFIAENEREATVIAADAYRQKREIDSQADAEAEKRLATARGARIKETVAQLAAASPGRPDLVVQAVAEVLQAEALPNLTTLVKGNAQPVVSVGGVKK